MSDNIQENDMEGILSSIKNILEEDEKKQQMAENIVSESADDVLGDILSTADVPDVLELSPDMVVDAYDEAQPNEGSIPFEAPEVYETPMIEESVGGKDAFAEVDVSEETGIQYVENAPMAETFFDEQTENVSTDDLLNEPFFENADNNEIALTNEPFFETNNNVVEDFVEPTQVAEETYFVEEAPIIEQTPIVEEFVEQTPVSEEVFEAIPDVFETNVAGNEDLSLDELLDTGNEVVLEEVVEQAPIIEEVPVAEEFVEQAPVVEDFVEPTQVAEETYFVEEAPIIEQTPIVEEFVEQTPVSEEVFEVAPVAEEIVEVTPVVEETAVLDPVIEIEPVFEEETQDVSANIMSNFAKMFSHEEMAEKTEIREVGNASKTLEEFVVDAIQNAIGNEISAKWNNGSDFNSFVETEIKRQVENWIANNMNDLIENMVKKEVERVIAKVGS